MAGKTNNDFVYHKARTSTRLRPMNSVARSFAEVELGVTEWDGEWFSVEAEVGEQIIASLGDEGFTVSEAA